MHKCKDITPYDNNGKAHGYWELYHPNGKLAYKGNYIHGLRHGDWEGYRSDGKLSFKGKYDMGQEIGLSNINNKTKFYARM